MNGMKCLTNVEEKKHWHPRVLPQGKRCKAECNPELTFVFCSSLGNSRASIFVKHRLRFKLIAFILDLMCVCTSVLFSVMIQGSTFTCYYLYALVIYCVLSFSNYNEDRLKKSLCSQKCRNYKYQASHSAGVTCFI